MPERPQRVITDHLGRLWPMLWCVLVTAIGHAYSTAASLTLDPVFTDAMVLQRETDVPVWGEAEPGIKITVSFAGKLYIAHADEQGNWQALLSPMKASATPSTLRVRAGEEEVSIQNVHVGEVWLLAGQSNMDFPLASCIGGKALAQQLSKNEMVRLLDHAMSVPGGANAWPLEVCTSLKSISNHNIIMSSIEIA